MWYIVCVWMNLIWKIDHKYHGIYKRTKNSVFSFVLFYFLILLESKIFKNATVRNQLDKNDEKMHFD